MSSETIIFSLPEKRFLNALLLGIVLPLADATALNTALPALGVSFPAAPLAWLVVAYLLAAVAAVPLSAALGQGLGEVRLWRACLLLFALSSAMAAVANSFAVLLAARVGQGVAAGLMQPLLQTLCARVMPSEKLRPALTALAVPAVITPIAAPLLASALLKVSSWHWIFAVNVPLCAWALVWSRWIPALSANPARDFDGWGYVCLAPALVLLVYAVQQAAWQPEPLIAGAVGLMLGGLFVIHAKRQGERALVRLDLLHLSAFRRELSLLFWAAFNYYGGILLLPILWTNAHHDVAWIGILLAAHGVGTLIARRYLERLAQRWGERRLLSLAASAVLLSSLALLFPLNTASALALMSLRGSGVGLLSIMPMAALYRTINAEHRAQASLLSRLATQFAAAFGSALAALAVSQPMVSIGLFAVSGVLMWVQIWQGEKTKAA
ncbi:MFS transporter [Avibacterium sp. 21-599]|uniref:MFS transporter n=1 Tax=Avibacterium sp. 21-599 TaxID=2911528 RepID=UPI002246E559|nr:MFS transporter [Avibacterium sp. 21-599]MCW9718846.1 MFS transporter [Avibacterium sp. 21-599]